MAHDYQFHYAKIVHFFVNDDNQTNFRLIEELKQWQVDH